jgi:hypothetical protein
LVDDRFLQIIPAGGGFADIAFLIYNKNSFDIRNHFIFRGAGLMDDPGGFFLV